MDIRIEYKVRPFYSNRRIGGIRFIRIGKLQLSFCVVR
jgi:hypothetical protein